MLNSWDVQFVARYDVRNESKRNVGSRTIDGSPVRYRNVTLNDKTLREYSGSWSQEWI